MSSFNIGLDPYQSGSTPLTTEVCTGRALRRSQGVPGQGSVLGAKTYL